MKKILIVVPTFHTGGTVTALLNLITLIDPSRYKVFVYSINREGVMKETVSRFATIVGDSSVSNGNKTNKVLKAQFFVFIKTLVTSLKSIGIDLTSIILRKMAQGIEREKYDTVIAFQEGTATKFVGYFKNPNKYAWVRSEYSRYLRLAKTKPEIAIYNKFKNIVCVSKASVHNFIECIPEVEGRVVHIYDIINDKRVVSLSTEPMLQLNKEDLFTIVSIGRLDPVKRFSKIPQIAESLRNKGLKFRWYIIGGASLQNKDEEKLIKNNIYRHNVADVVLMLGQMSNPYVYLKASDLLVCLSSSETFNYTLTEAKILDVPVVTTDYACASESIEDGEQGIIVPIEKVEDAIHNLMTDSMKYKHIKENLSHYKYDGSKIMDDIYHKILD